MTAIDFGLRGRHALVTGGSHGIGLAIARALAAAGCHIAICSRTRERLDAAEENLRGTGVDVLSFEADVLNTTDIHNTTAAIDGAWGGVDILVNNVGGGGRWGEPNVEQTDPGVWDDVYRKNAGAAIGFTRWAIPAMLRGQWGRVVTVASLHGKEGGGRPWFSMAKSAQISMMKSLASTHYLVRGGITFNTVAPGSIMIPNTGWAEERDRDPVAHAARVDRDFPLGRLGSPEEVASVVAFLCSEKASLVNGACIAVDGGESRSF